MPTLKKQQCFEAPYNSHGGKRKGAGRPTGHGPYHEATAPMRIPKSKRRAIRDYLENDGYRLPVYSSRVPAGMPLPPAEGEERVDLNSFFNVEPSNCYMLQVSGDSMIKAGIDDGDWLLVKSNVQVRNDDIVVAMVDGQVTVKRFKKEKSGAIILSPENDAYKPIRIAEGQTFEISGVVAHAIKRL